MRLQQIWVHGLLASLLAGGLLSSALPVWSGPLDANRLYNQGVDHYSKGNTQLAIEMFERSIQMDPNNVDAYFNLGSVYYQTQQFEKARGAFENVVRLAPQDSQAKYSLALTLEKQGRNTEAIQVLQQIPSRDGRYRQATKKIEQLRQQPAQAQTQAQPQKNAWRAKETKPSTTPAPSTPATGETKREIQTFANGFFGPTGMVLLPDGGLLVANYSRNMIIRVTPAGDKAVFAEGDALKGPLGMVRDTRDGAIYVVNYLSSNVVKITPAGSMSVIASGLNKPYHLLLDPSRNMLYVSEQETNTVSRILLSR